MPSTWHRAPAGSRGPPTLTELGWGGILVATEASDRDEALLAASLSVEDEDTVDETRAREQWWRSPDHREVAEEWTAATEHRWRQLSSPSRTSLCRTMNGSQYKRWRRAEYGLLHIGGGWVRKMHCLPAGSAELDKARTFVKEKVQSQFANHYARLQFYEPETGQRRGVMSEAQVRSVVDKAVEIMLDNEGRYTGPLLMMRFLVSGGTDCALMGDEHGSLRTFLGDTRRSSNSVVMGTARPFAFRLNGLAPYLQRIKCVNAHTPGSLTQSTGRPAGHLCVCRECAHELCLVHGACPECTESRGSPDCAIRAWGRSCKQIGADDDYYGWRILQQMGGRGPEVATARGRLDSLIARIGAASSEELPGYLSCELVTDEDCKWAELGRQAKDRVLASAEFAQYWEEHERAGIRRPNPNQTAVIREHDFTFHVTGAGEAIRIRRGPAPPAHQVVEPPEVRTIRFDVEDAIQLQLSPENDACSVVMDRQLAALVVWYQLQEDVAAWDAGVPLHEREEHPLFRWADSQIRYENDTTRDGLAVRLRGIGHETFHDAWLMDPQRQRQLSEDDRDAAAPARVLDTLYIALREPSLTTLLSTECVQSWGAALNHLERVDQRIEATTGRTRQQHVLLNWKQLLVASLAGGDCQLHLSFVTKRSEESLGVPSAEVGWRDFLWHRLARWFCPYFAPFASDIERAQALQGMGLTSATLMRCTSW